MSVFRAISFICVIFGIINVVWCLPFSEPSRSYAYYSRDQWGGSPPTDVRPLKKPAPYVVVHHTAVPGACYSTDDCSRSMRSMQNYHNSLDWGDIGYNFCVGSEGGAYVGRGWDVVGIHAGRANNFSVGICLIGDWREELPPRIQLETTKALIADGIKVGAISPQYKLIGHKQATATECPGTSLMKEIATWDNYQGGHIDF